jgi:release factor glutamine methyltransferase
MTGEPITVVEVLRRAQGYLAGRGVDTPRLDAELLLANVLNCDRLTLYTGFDRPLSTTETDTYRTAIGRRGNREPAAYILGHRGFRTITLDVTPDVLVPRPETELLVEWVLEVAPHGARVLDWGTGSGAIAVALATERPDLTVTGIDRSAAALEVARRNDPQGGVQWLVSDGFAALDGHTFDVIAANPPYIAEAEMSALAPELAYEPREALVSGPSGLECYRAIASDCAVHLATDGIVVVEIGATQASAVSALFGAAGLTDIAVRTDLAGHERAVGARR